MVSFGSATAKTATGAVGFTITRSDTDGTVAGTFTVNGKDYALTGSGGVLSGATGTPLEGMSVSITALIPPNVANTGILNLAPVATNLSVASTSDAIFTGAKASFAVRGTDGVIKAFEVTNNSLNGLRDAINASGAGVSASIINVGSGAKPYQLIITAKDTGTGTTTGVVTLAAIANADATPYTMDGALGITAGTLTGIFSSPTVLTGGLGSDISGIKAQDSVFTLNGTQLTRKTNVVSDAADGVTFTLKQGGQTGTTTLTVAQDKATATAGMQDLLTKFNALVKTYKDASTATQDANGTILPAPLTGDATSRDLVAQIRSTLTGSSAGLSGSAAFQDTGSAGRHPYDSAHGSRVLHHGRWSVSFFQPQYRVVCDDAISATWQLLHRHGARGAVRSLRRLFGRSRNDAGVLTSGTRAEQPEESSCLLRDRHSLGALNDLFDIGELVVGSRHYLQGILSPAVRECLL